MKYFLSNYKANAKNSDISFRVDVKRGRVYMPKKYIGKRVDIDGNGNIVIVKNKSGGVLVNRQGFASVSKLPSNELMELAEVVNGKK